jgi:hypothetical protein
MWTSKEEALQLLEDESFVTYCDHNFLEEYRLIVGDLHSPDRNWMGVLGLLRLAAAYQRLAHPARLATSFLNPSSEGGRELRPLIGREFIELVELVSMAHGWDVERVLHDDLLRPRSVNALLNLRYVAQLLRLGDLLDVGEGRVSSLLWSYLRPLGSESEAHWRKEARLKLDRCEPDRIELSGIFDIRREGIVEAEGYRLALDWIAWLNKEVEAALVLTARQDQEFRSRCRFGALKVDATRVQAVGLELGGRVSFEIDRGQILNILSSAIYERGLVFVRELLQNAVDATRAQIVRDMADAVPGLDAERPWSWPADVTQSDRYG